MALLLADVEGNGSAGAARAKTATRVGLCYICEVFDSGCQRWRHYTESSFRVGESGFLAASVMQMAEMIAPALVVKVLGKLADYTFPVRGVSFAG
jgi:hypothetical protein